MNNLKIVYKILKSIEDGLSDYEYKGMVISPESLEIGEQQWLQIIQMLIDEELIRGARIFNDVLDEINVDIKNIAITLKGLQYLKENSVMAKFAKTATNVITLVKP